MRFRKYNFFKIKVSRVYIVLTLVGLFLVFSCSVTKAKQSNNENIVKTFISKPSEEHAVKAVLWQQTAGEYRALCYQAYSLAKLQLDNILESESKQEKPLAIITDIDETVLDNSPFSAKMIELDEGFRKQRWVEWGKKESAKPVPGALDFFKYAASKGVTIFYISNRYDIQLNETIENLEKTGFPQVNAQHVLLKEDTSEKQPRRDIVLKNHNVVMLLGDNLSDFLSAFRSNSIKERNQLVDDLKEAFGKKFIVLPNPMYGDWETHGIYKGKYDWSEVEKDSIRKGKLISY